MPTYYSGYDTGANILTGAGGGAAVGTAIMPGIGTAIGAGAGALAGIFQSIAQYDNEKQRREALKELSDKINANYNQLQSQFDKFYATYSPGGTEKDLTESADAIRNFDYSKYDWMDTNGDGKVDEDEKEAAKYTYNRDIDFFMNPYLEDLQSDAAAKVEHTAAGAGLGRGTGAARAVANSVADIKDKAYNTALNEWKADRDFDYKTWSDANEAARKRLSDMMLADQWQIGQQKSLGEDWLNWQTSEMENRSKITEARNNAMAQLGV